MLPNRPDARAFLLALTVSLSASGCGFIQSIPGRLYTSASAASDAFQTPLARTGLYLHEDQYQQKADSAVADFNKIDLSSKFDEQFKRVTGYDNEEDQAVAALETASRNQRLQDFIELPAWWQPTCSVDENNKPVPCCINARGSKAMCSGTTGLGNEVRRRLNQLTGMETLTPPDRLKLRKALFLTPELAKSIDDERKSLAIFLNVFIRDGGHSPPNPCSPEAPKIDPPPPLICAPSDLACDWKRIEYVCGLIADDLVQQQELQTSLGIQGELRDLMAARKQAVDARKKDQEDADTLTGNIAKITNPDTQPEQVVTVIDQVKKYLNGAGPGISAAAKYFGYSGLADKLQSLLTGQLNKNTAQANNSHKTQTQNSGSKPQPSPTPIPNSNQVQALIDLATSTENLADDYAGKDPHARVNALLLAAAAARHQADMAKLDADYQGDLITIYNAEIDARLREVIHLDEANVALAVTQFPAEQGLVPPLTSSPSQAQLDALAAWVASQDEGEIPFQVLAAKEIQLLRAESVKQGQLSALGYENIIKPVLKQLDAYAKGGVTTQAIVQALGFVGVITSISTK